MYGFNTTFPGTVDQAISKVTKALAAEGFGVLTEIDVKATLKKKLDIDRLPYHILGACNPQIAHQALETEPDLGLLLPCNVIVREEDDGSTTVGFIDPEAMLSIVGRDEMMPFASEVRERLERVKAAIEA